ncbi:hypothetical protein KP509_10G053800 [Ceratopteris richardii]|uniref:U-box domain-containing protein n=1 Tax=Ceratopteris richardii TaxID=49495 RepID=A0A8T2U1H8_CERRI|nr:hypothetical protein KP509_10G053800 [Ceratopteris richardii]
MQLEEAGATAKVRGGYNIYLQALLEGVYMFRACTAAAHGGASSPTSRHKPQHPSLRAEDDIFEKLIHLESPPSSSFSSKTGDATCQSPCIVDSTPPRLTLPASNTLRSPLLISSTQSWASLESPSASSPLSVTNHDSPDGLSVNLFDSSGSSPSNLTVEEILRRLRDFPPLANSHIHFQELAHLLKSLHSFCSSSETALNLCVSEGCVETILKIMNTDIDAQRCSSVAIQSIEIASRQLQLLIASSTCACEAAFNKSSLTISTLKGKLLQISEACTESAISILTMLCRYPSACAIDFCKAVSETSIPCKLVVVLQVALKESTKRRAARLLRLLEKQRGNL